MVAGGGSQIHLTLIGLTAFVPSLFMAAPGLRPPASLLVLHHPAVVLRQTAAPIVQITDHVRAVALRMIVLMHAEDGIGLAAPQVGLSWRMFVAHVPEAEGRSARPEGAALPDATAVTTIFKRVYLRQF